VDTLFEELLVSEHNTNDGDGPQHTDKDLVKYVNNFLRVHCLSMSMNEVSKWRARCQEYERAKPLDRKDWTGQEKVHR
jgi:hypothetical protein